MNRRFLCRSALLFLAFIVSAFAAHAGIVSQAVLYQSEGMKFEDYLANDDAVRVS